MSDENQGAVRACFFGMAKTCYPRAEDFNICARHFGSCRFGGRPICFILGNSAITSFNPERILGIWIETLGYISRVCLPITVGVAVVGAFEVILHRRTIIRSGRCRHRNRARTCCRGRRSPGWVRTRRSGIRRFSCCRFLCGPRRLILGRGAIASLNPECI
ncbi:hypothetical protein ES708_23126 [subsurface metagenome]